MCPDISPGPQGTRNGVAKGSVAVVAPSGEAGDNNVNQGTVGVRCTETGLKDSRGRVERTMLRGRWEGLGWGEVSGKPVDAKR
jgi:hypothetical protein